MPQEHHYSLTVTWRGNKGDGTSDYKTYSRNHTVSAEGKSVIECSSDPVFRGDKTRYNPEEMLVASLSSCHMLWFLHLCADAGVVVIDYSDNAKGTMIETATGGGHFTEVVLHPHVVVEDEAMIERTYALHEKAHKLCFIANSVNFPVRCIAECVVK